MNWCIVQSGNIVDGPRTWEPSAMSRALAKLGLSVSLPSVELSHPILLGEDVSVLPVIYDNPVISSAQKITGELFTIGQESVACVRVIGDKTEVEINPPMSDDERERKQLENKYLEATKALCQLAGDQIPDGVWPKLEDVEFESKAITALANDPGTVTLLLSTLNYTFFQLKLTGWSWEQIEYRPEVSA